MRVFAQVIVAVVSMLFGTSFVHAQITNDPSGHWEGSITMPFGELRFEVDLTSNGPGQLLGTFGGTELAGTHSTPQGRSLPLTLRRND